MSKELLEAEKALAEKKAAHIKGLLDERVQLRLSTDERLDQIAQELKALGHKERQPRGPNKVKVETPTVDPAQQVEEAYDIRS